MSMDILVVDDEADIRGLISEILKDEGYEVRQAGSSDQALGAIAERVPSLMVLDIWLKGSELDGLGILEIALERYPNLPVVMISGHGTIETAVQAIKMGAMDFVEKPFDSDKLLHVIQKATEVSRLKLENQELRLHSIKDEELIGDSVAIQQVQQTIERVAPTNSRVLIAGEEGTGKEIVARELHEQSLRAQGNFVVFNAGNIAPAQVESELFGVEEASQAGGAAHLGMIERAHGGTLFLDEVADLSRETQSKLLSALQKKSFTRVRGQKDVQVDVRVVAATSRDLQNEIRQGNFREDLYYRLNVVPLDMPSLRERRDDVPALCSYFMKQAAEASGIPTRAFTQDAMTVLQAYDWPGNVRHLRNIVEWVLIMNSNKEAGDIEVDMLPPELLETQSSMMKMDDNTNIMSLPLREAREIFERQYLSAQIARFGGNISKTSAFIGMERSALHRKLKMLGIHSDEKMSA